MSDSLRRHVGARVIVDVSEPAELVLQLAVSGMPGAGLEETLVVTRDGSELQRRR